MLLDDAVSDGQAQARAALLALLRSGLGGEERIVDALNVFLRDSAAGVGDAHAHGLRRCVVATVSVPPPGIASLAFKNRFRNTCCSFPELP